MPCQVDFDALEHTESVFSIFNSTILDIFEHVNSTLWSFLFLFNYSSFQIVYRHVTILIPLCFFVQRRHPFELSDRVFVAQYCLSNVKQTPLWWARSELIPTETCQSFSYEPLWWHLGTGFCEPKYKTFHLFLLVSSLWFQPCFNPLRTFGILIVTSTK